MKNIPVLSITEKTLAEAYEAAIVAVYEKGTRFKTQYDKPEDPESMDCTINITIEEPESDPMIHMAFPGGIEELKEYVMELKGFKDHWTKNMNVGGGRENKGGSNSGGHPEAVCSAFYPTGSDDNLDARH